MSLTLPALLGNIGLVVVFAASVVGSVLTIVALIRTRVDLVRLAPFVAGVIALGATTSVIGMQIALAQRDYTLAYIQKVGSSHTPTLFNIAAMWSSLEGSILLWLFVLAGYTLAVGVRFSREISEPLVGWAMAVMFVTCAFFAVVSIGPANPFALGPPVAPGFDGPGPVALLQDNALVLFHPPMLYLGYVGFTVPFAFALGALVTGTFDDTWLRRTRRWTLFSWGWLTLGIVLGGWWAYQVLGWGGAWGWDAVENVSLIPWLTSTAYIHSIMAQEHSGLLRVWNLSLMIATFALTILGTFLTRSGVVESVHAFAGGALDGYLLGFFVLIVAIGLALIWWRGDRLRGHSIGGSPVSRVGALLANNVLFTVFAAVILTGTVYPLMIELVEGRKSAVGKVYFDTVSMPLGMAILLLMAIAPVLPWKRTTAQHLAQRLYWPAATGVCVLAVAVAAGADRVLPLLGFGLGGFAAGTAIHELFRRVKRLGWGGLFGRAGGGMVAHIGVIVLAMALVASNAYTTTTLLTVRTDDPTVFRGHTFQLREVAHSSDRRTSVARAHILMDGTTLVAPAASMYLKMGHVLATPGVSTSATHDVYITLAGVSAPEPGADEVSVEVSIKPLIIWLWVGGALMAVGALMAAIPRKHSGRTAT